MDLAIIPECYVDTNMIETLVPPTSHYNHQKGCGTVAKVMQEKYADAFALGIIDKDKQELDYLKEFDIVSQKGSLILHKHKAKNHYFIQVQPAMEAFMLNAAGDVGLNMADFQLPDDMKELKKQAKSTTSKSDQRFKKLFKALLEKQAADIVRLKDLVGHLKNNPYAGITDALKAI